jgi:hypothetical protein
MKKLSQIIFTLAMALGLALSVSAQKDDKNRPPKNPPVVNPGEKKPPRNPPPKDDKGPKKPGSESYLVTLSRKDHIV